MTNSPQKKPIFLIGMPGTGKTRIGKALAPMLVGYNFVDSDEYIENKQGKTINEIFKTEEEKFFRDVESQVLQELSAKTKSVIATGGGIILRPENRELLKYYGVNIWLDSSLDLLVS